MAKFDKKKLPSTYQEFRFLFEPIVGEDKTEELLEAIGNHFGGQQAYVQSYALLTRENKHKAIRKEFDGSAESMRGLSRKHKISMSQLRHILANKQ